MYEYVGNMHAHTTYSDGAKTHAVVAAAAIKAGLDFMITTDHNALVEGVAGLYQNGDGGQVLLLTGEEVHDMTLAQGNQGNHLLVYGAGQELSAAGQNRPPQELLDAVNAAGGLSFIAHPVAQEVPWAGEPDLGWHNWDISGYTGLEIWNYMTSMEELLPNPVQGIKALLTPMASLVGPDPDALALWDDLLAQGQRVPVIGGADAHGSVYRFGPLVKIIYKYEFLFRCVNTHVLLPDLLTGDWLIDGPLLYQALARGNMFVGYGIPGDPRGFRFTAVQDGAETAQMGDAVALDACDELRITAPAPARLRILRQGEVVAEEVGETLTYRPTKPGAYRVEAWKKYRRRERAWILSNPIYVFEE